MSGFIAAQPASRTAATNKQDKHAPQRAGADTHPVDLRTTAATILSAT
jgi:hypothetical protein